MNERIKKLLNEATSGHEQEHDRSKVMSVSDKELEIFAQLIVQECGQWVNDNLGLLDEEARSDLLKHFGVEW
jgi:hypothetical protein